MYLSRYELISLDLSINQGTLPTPIAISVINTSDSSILHTLSYIGNTLQFVVREGMIYKIQYANIDSNINTPPSFIMTAEFNNQRTVEGVYIVFVNGVYIGYDDNTISPYDQLVPGNTPRGVVLKTNNIQILIYPEEYKSDWETVDNMHHYPGMTRVDTVAEASLDFNGRKNTTAVLQDTWGGHIWVYISNIRVGGRKDVYYMPAAGEMLEIMNNKGAINVAFSLIGGTQISGSQYYWTSTGILNDWKEPDGWGDYMDGIAVAMAWYYNSNKYLAKFQYKSWSNYSRAITHFPLSL